MAGASGAPAGPPAAPAPPRLEQYIPRELLGRLEAARSAHSMEGERRVVTVLFCDVKGSTAMAEGLDPEEWATIMNGAFEHLIRPVYRYEGTLARLMGDAVLALFGAPIAHEDDAQRAVLAGLAILEGIQPYRAQVQRTYGLDFNVRVGINTGLVVVGEVGSDLRVEYTAMGDAVNLAARMEQTAAPGTVRISGNTHRLVASLFECTSLGGVEIKGKAEPVPAYEVLAARSGAVRARGVPGLASPIVGREQEMATLSEALRRVQGGSGQVVTVMGEAGLGKSRLKAELRATLPTMDGPVTWWEGQSLSYDAATPYAPIVALFTDAFGLALDASGPDQYAAMRAAIDARAPEQVDDLVPFFGTLLNVPLPEADAQRVRYLEPPRLRAQVFAAVTSLVEAAATQAPLVLVLEDLHWVDPTSLDLIQALLPLTDRVPLLLLALFRPQREDPSWRFHEAAARDYAHRYTPITLEPLDDAGSRQLVANLLTIEDLPERVRRLILDKAEGNPFFVEEVIRSLLDANLVVQRDGRWHATREIDQLAVPDTLAGVITARLDRLDDAAKRAAQTAAVVGREFRYAVLEHVYDRPAGLSTAVADLQRRQIVREQVRLPQRIYLFKHVLTQETAYASLLLSRRRELHGRVAGYLEDSAPERVTEIARHWLAAREEARALPALVAAGEQAARAYATPEAIEWFRRALAVLERVDDPALARRAYEGLGGALTLANDLPAAMETYHAMLHRGEQYEQPPMLVSARNKMAFVAAMRMGQLPEAGQHLDVAEHLARAANDLPGLAEMYVLRCNICTMTAQFDRALEYLQEAAAIGQQVGSPEQTAFGLIHASNMLLLLLRFDEALASVEEGLTVARAVNQRERESEGLVTSLSMYHLVQGNLPAAADAADEGTRIAYQIGHIYGQAQGPATQGTIARLQGDYEAAITYYEQGIQAARPLQDTLPFMLALGLGGLGAAYQEVGPGLLPQAVECHTPALAIMQTPFGMPVGGFVWADLGFCALATGAIDQAAACFENGLTMPSMHMHLQRPRLLVGSAEVALARGRVDAAAARIAEARAFADTHHLRGHAPLVAVTAGRVAICEGDPQRALAEFARGVAKAEAMGMRPLIWQAHAGAAGVLAALGREREAAAARRAAEAMIAEIGGRFTREDLRAQWLASAGPR
ncbi:MAG TPA: adenylate/guanylate cyclase domain-containing protein, partial [Chloroflexia bacterium]|nr:adenylate/guanylate cyclase domain-containing protein [Chloroflexia bacterium]